MNEIGHQISSQEELLARQVSQRKDTFNANIINFLYRPWIGLTNEFA